MRFHETGPKCARTRDAAPCYPNRALALGTNLLLLALPAFAGFPNGYNNCKVVTTQHAMVSGAASLTNYPLTVILTDNDLKAVANGGQVQSAAGYDIGFYPDCSGSGTALKWELESYSPATGAIIAHVLRPALSNATDDTIGMFYGGSFGSFQSSVGQVWNSGYAGVYHLPDGTTLSTTDSTANALTLSNTGIIAAAGKLGGGAGGYTASNYLSRPTNALYDSADWTAEAWVYLTSWPTGYGAAMVSNAEATSSAGHFMFYVNNAGKLSVDIPYVAGGVVTGATALSLNSWHHVAATKSGNTYSVYLDGAGNGSASNGTAPTTGCNLYIGNIGPANNLPVAGMLDEARVSNVARPADWILTEYRNQSAAGTYISAGPRLTQTTRVKHSVKGDG